MEVQSQLQPLENLGQRFEQFGSIQTGVRNQILAHSPDEIGQWKKEEREKFAASVLSTIPPLASKRYLPYVEKPLNNYLEREAAITSWLTEKGGLDRPEVRASLVHAFSPAEEIHEDNLASDTMQFRRIHDGFALIVSPDTFQSLVVKRLRKGRDTITDPQDIARELSMYAEVGFLLNSAGIPKELGFPEGTKLVIACDEKALAHERSEVLAANIISAMDDVPRARRLEGIAIRSVSDKSFDIFPVRKALSDLAARVEEGGIPDTLSSLGVTQEYADSHPQEAKLVKAIFTAIRTRPNVFENRQELANLIRGGLLVPENLAAHLLGARDVAKILSETSLDETDFELSLESIKEGSFVYFRPTLRAGETLDHQNITYTVKRIVSQGGQGGLYEVTAGGKSFAVKEMLFPLPSAASHQKLVPFFIDGLWESQLPLNFTGNPIDHIDLPTYLNDLKQFASQLDYTGATRGQSLVERIDQHVLPQLAHIQANGTSVYKAGELQLTKFDPQNGLPIQLTPVQKQLIFTEITQAAKEELAAIVSSPSGKALANQLNQAQERFIGESEILFSLSGISGIAASRGIKFADIDNPDNPKWQAVYMIQEWAEGKNLASVLDLEGQPKIWEYQHSVDFMRELLTIITEVHRRGIFHKDLKPENIMENLQGHPLLVDFGIAKGSIASTSQAFRSGTQSYGTDGFAPPEVFAGSDARSDIYSLGMVLFTMLTGKDPRLIPNGSPDEIPLDPGKAPERRAMVEKILRNEQDPSGNQKIPDKLIQVILKAIDPDQAKRFQTAAAMDEELRDIRIVSVDQHLDTLFAAMNKKYFSHFYSRYPDGVKPDEEKGPRFNTIMYAIDFYDDEGKFHSQKFEDKYRLDHANPWPKEIKEYVQYLKTTIQASPHRAGEMLGRLEQFATYNNYLDPHLGPVAYVAGRDAMLEVLSEYIKHNLPTPAWLDMVEHVLQDYRFPGVIRQTSYIPLLESVAQADSNRRNEIIKRCIAWKDLNYPSAVRTMMKIYQLNRDQNLPLQVGWLDSIEDILIKYPYASGIYSRYPDGVKPDKETDRYGNITSYAIDFYDDEGKFHSQKFEDKYRLDHANPWPKEIKEYVDLLKQLSADSIKHAEIIKRITQWQQSQTGHFNRHFWSTLSKRLIDELRPNQRTVVSP